MNETRLVLLTAIFSFATIFIFSCGLTGEVGGEVSSSGGGDNPSSSSVGGSSVGCPVSAVLEGSVTCGGQTYRTVTIDEQVWFAENLNYAGEDAGNPIGTCYGSDDTADCVTYGRLYNWSTAMGLSDDCNSSNCSSQIQSKHRGVCPSGWHIPTNEEWDILINYVGDSYVAGTKLKATSGWGGYDGTDDYGFSALPGGIGNYSSNLNFTDAGCCGYWWTTSESWADYAIERYIVWDSGVVGINTWRKSTQFSVRCLKD